MKHKTELSRPRRSWVFTKIGASLIPVSIIYSWYLLIDMQTQERQGNMDGMVWVFKCFSLIGFCVVISLIGFVIDLFRNRQKVVVQEKSKTNSYCLVSHLADLFLRHILGRSPFLWNIWSTHRDPIYFSL